MRWRSYSEIFQVDNNGKWHPHVLIGWHHTSAQRNNSLTHKHITLWLTMLWRSCYVCVTEILMWHSWGESSLLFTRLLKFQRRCGRSPWGGCWRTCWFQSFSSRSLHSRARSCLWWWRIFVPRKTIKQQWVNPVGLKGTNVCSCSQDKSDEHRTGMLHWV